MHARRRRDSDGPFILSTVHSPDSDQQTGAPTPRVGCRLTGTSQARKRNDDLTHTSQVRCRMTIRHWTPIRTVLKRREMQPRPPRQRLQPQVGDEVPRGGVTRSA